MAKLKKEFKSFLEDIENNLKNQEDLQYVKTRFEKFVNSIMDEIDMVVADQEDRMNELEENQKQMESKMSKMQEILDNIEKDIYSEDGFDFEIICPYCDNQFIIDMDEDKTEVECPECNNIIELDWSGEPEDDTANCSSGCAGCHGCGTNLENNIPKEQDSKNEEENNDDDM